MSKNKIFYCFCKKILDARTILFILLVIFSMNILAGENSKRKKYSADYVDPFICTQGDHGQWIPAAKVPFGLVEIGPDTYPGSLTADGDFAHGGYDFSDNQLRGFSNIHRASSGGTTVGDRAGFISMLPFTGMPPDTFFRNPVLEFDKKNETAKAGSYKVHLIKDDISVELTATAHAALHRYLFPAKKQAKIFLYEGRTNSGMKCRVVDKKIIEGVHSVFGGIYFVMKFNHALQKTLIHDGQNIIPGKTLDKIKNTGIILDFGDLEGKALEVKVGISLTSVQDAYKNLDSECPRFEFEKTKRNAWNKWNNILDNIAVDGEEEYKTIFYTALYHTCFLPTTITNADGTFPGLDQQIHVSKSYTNYGNYSFWDSFRTKYPLYSLYLPSVYRDIIKSIANLYKYADWNIKDVNHAAHAPKFLLKGINGYTLYKSICHEHMLMTVTDAYFKGLFDKEIDLNTIYPYIKQEALVQMGEKYDKIGYIPARPDQTGEYCWDNWCVAQVAKTTGNEKDYNYFMKRSDYWKNTWDPSIKFFRARAENGEWLDFPEDPSINREKYTYEGTKWQWRWNVIHDVPGLIKVFGGKENFIKELSYFFEHDLYTAGNQPDLQAPFLFNFADAAWLTQKWTHKILTEPMIQLYGTHNKFKEPVNDRIYKAAPDGYLEEMDDDYGCMSAWYAMSAMGLFQVCTGNPVYQLSSPIFEKVTIKLDRKIYSEKEFVIKTKNLSKENFYIQSASLNGKPLNRSWISHDEITKGGKLVFIMGKEPNKDWGNYSKNTAQDKK